MDGDLDQRIELRAKRIDARIIDWKKTTGRTG